MATISIDLTEAVTDVGQAAVLVGGLHYTLQAVGGEVRFQVAATAPTVTASTPYLQLVAGGYAVVTFNAAEPIWAWTPSGSARLVVNEAT